MKWWRMLPGMMTVVLVLGLVAPVGAQRPDPHSGAVPSPQATPAVTDCSLVEPYATGVFAAFDRYDDFYAFLGNYEITYGDLTAAEAEAIIEEGNALVADLEALDPPQAYQPAHDGLITMLQFNIDLARFYGLDTSRVPDISAEDQAWIDIDAGERALAEACTDEVEELGGYVVFEPLPLEDEIQDPPE